LALVQYVGMKLSAYIEKRGLSVTAFAKEAGLETTVAWRAVNGGRIPSPKTISAIVAATGGKVKAQDFYDEIRHPAG